MKRPAGLTIIAVLTVFGTAGLALGSSAFFFVAVMGMTGRDAGEPVSDAIVGMGIAGGTLLLVLAAVAGCLTFGVLKLCEWARIISIVSIAAGIVGTILSLFVFRGYRVLPVVPSILCHLVVMAAAVWMLLYLLHPRIKQVFGALAS